MEYTGTETVVLRAELVKACQRLMQTGFRLLTMIGTDERERTGHFILRYYFAADRTSQIALVTVRIPATDPTYPSVATIIPAASWYEREVYDLLGIQPIGHPDLRPLVLHGQRVNAYPLRRDYPLLQSLPEVRRELQEPALDEGQFIVPVGPIHAGVIEPGHFRFLVAGENVESLDAQLFYTHRGLEKRAEGMHVAEAMALVEQTCGVCSVSHALSYAQAVEAVAQIQLAPQAIWIRTLLAELERLYNHVGDVGNLCAGIGFSFGTMQGARLKEQLQQLNDDVTGHRYLRGVIVVGGVAKTFSFAEIERIRVTTMQILQEIGEITDAILSDEIVCDRFNRTGVLDAQVVEQWSVVGPAARASGVVRDVRMNFPYAGYGELEFSVPTFQTGDVMARFQQRIAEIYESGKLIDQIIRRLLELVQTGDGTPLLTPLPSLVPGSFAIGISESARGENVHFVMVGENQTIYRLRIRSASYANWPAVPYAVPGNIIPDFPLINKSFELCYACCDR
ncbi:NADH-quinone oxidoreductase subunit C [Sulfoacidibacillus thermotolerans]|uniref:NADH dehydrogenase n=1 Tax=Sulfoacidibacillus thermotolerans TaxID=1765684 RepID=A0A2U3D801_SULT2|nr:NADH-quinone oxidoreductase subunit C [Sulfoacidibacillus thermotolerans]PWI57416.1 hypothetical protein BM613_08820 [Sulfoacidibacillus thermotolerans]